METETIDRLYLELSQVTKARTGRELIMEDLLRRGLDLPSRTPGESWAKWAEWCHDVKAALREAP